MREGWTTKRLGDLCTIRPPKKETRANLDDNAEVGFLPMEDLGIRQQAVTTSQTKALGEVYKGYTYFADGDVLLAKITPCFQNGKLGIARDLPNGVGFGSSEYFVLRSNGEVLPEYLFYFLSQDSFTEGGVRQMSGAVGHQRVPPEYVASQEIPLPPLAEQKRIVAILDEAFEAIERAEAGVQESLQRVNDLFRCALMQNLLVSQADHPRATLASMSLEFGRGRSRHRPRNASHLYGGNIPFVQTGDIRNADHLLSTYTQTYSDAGLTQSKLWPKGTICITIAANIAETAILGFDACFPDSVIGLVVDPDKADIDFVEYLLQAFKIELQGEGKGSAQDNINMGTFENRDFPMPPLSEQRRLAILLNAISDDTGRLKALYRDKLDAIERLKQSMLADAFGPRIDHSDSAPCMEAIA